MDQLKSPQLSRPDEQLDEHRPDFTSKDTILNLATNPSINDFALRTQTV